MKYKFFLARVYSYLAELAMWEEELAQAEQWLAQSLSYHADPHRIALYEVGRLFVAARLATAQQRYLLAATLFGVADRAHSHIHYAIAGPMLALADAALATVHEMLDPTVFAEVFTAGQQMSPEEAFAMILSPGQVVVGP